MTPLLNPRDVARLLAVHRNTVQRIPASELPYVRVTNRGDRRYRAEDLAAYIERRRVS